MRQGSTKPNIDFATKDIINSPQIAGYTITASSTWEPIGGGFSITVNKTGIYLVEAIFTMFLDYSSQNNQQGKARLAVNGTPVPNTYVGCSREMPGVSDKSRHPFNISKRISLIAGQTVTIEAWKGNSDPVQIMYAASSFDGCMEAELLEAYVNVSTVPNAYIRRTNGGTRGSVNTNVVIYGTGNDNDGSGVISYVNSATNGDSFVVNVAGIYSVSVTGISSSACFYEIRVGSIDNTTGDNKTRTQYQSQAGESSSFSWMGYISAGSAIWVYSGAAPLGLNVNSNQISINRVS